MTYYQSKLLPSSPVGLQAGEVRIAAGYGNLQKLMVHMPKVLSCSQLPGTVVFPLGITLTVVEQQAAGAVPSCSCPETRGCDA